MDETLDGSSGTANEGLADSLTGEFFFLFFAFSMRSSSPRLVCSIDKFSNNPIIFCYNLVIKG
jgi:hypothetical protein